MYAFEATAEFLNKTNSEIKTQHQAAAKFLSSFAQSQYSALQSGLGQAFEAAEKLPLAEKPLVIQTRTEIKTNLEKAVGVRQVYTQKGLQLFETKVPAVLDKGFSYAALALSQAESLTTNAITMSTSALEQAKKNERVKPVIEQAEQIADQLFSKIGVKAAPAKAKKPAAKKATAAKKPAAKKTTATRTKKASTAKA
ncbi:MAG: hypothetical protein R3194_08880 [Limnobacter sp.]|nr:hypothetical protein [Limnobacter sp.]